MSENTKYFQAKPRLAGQSEEKQKYIRDLN